MVTISILLFLFLIFALFRKKHLFKFIYWSFGAVMIFAFFFLLVSDSYDEADAPRQYVESENDRITEVDASEYTEELESESELCIESLQNEIYDLRSIIVSTEISLSQATRPGFGYYPPYEDLLNAFESANDSISEYSGQKIYDYCANFQ